MTTEPDTITVRGSYGELTVDRLSGAVLAYADPSYDLGNEGPEGEGEYSDIVRFDLNELRMFYGAAEVSPGSSWDIVLVGFWTREGTYVEAEADARALSEG